MNYFKLKFLLLFFALAVAIPPAWAGEVKDELTLSTFGVSGNTYTDVSGKKATSDAVYAGNLAGGNDAIQLRTDNSTSGIITTTSGGKVKSIKITFNSHTTAGRIVNVYGKSSAYTAASELYNTNTRGKSIGALNIDAGTTGTITIPEGEEYSYIGIKSSSKAIYLDKIVIVWETESGSTTEKVATPTFSPAGGNYNEAQNVTISCATDGAAIHYTTDGTEPTAESPVYSTAITVGETMTLKAIAMKDDMEPSSIASATYTFPITNLADANELKEGTEFVYNGYAVVTHVVDNNQYQNADVWIRDNQGNAAYLFRAKPLGFKNGDVLKTGWTATKDVYNGLNELKNVTMVKDGTAEAKPEIATEIKDTDVSKFVRLESISTIGNGVQWYDKFGTGETLDPNKTYNVEGIVGYNDGLQFYPITVEEIGSSQTELTITLNPAEETATVGETITVTVTTDSEAEFQATCDDANATVQQVNDGFTITSNTAGTYTVSVYATDGDLEKTVTGTYTFTAAPEPGVKTTYKKVTSTDQVITGKYLIVYEDDNIAFDGSRTSLDAVSNTQEVAISDNSITTDKAIYFTYDATAQTLKSASGFYIGQTKYDNGLATDQTTQYTNSIAIDEDANAVITAQFADGTDHPTLRYNSASNQLRFRYYKSGQKAIQLYKEVTGDAPEPDLAITLDPAEKSATAGENIEVTVTANTDAEVIYVYTCNPATATLTETATGFTITSATAATVTVTVNAMDEDSREATATGTYTFTAAPEPGTYCPAVIEFDDNGSDDTNTFSNLESFKNYIINGKDFVSNMSCDKVYPGATGIKFSSSKGNGYLTINLANLSRGSWATTKIIVNAKKYGSDDAKISVNDSEEFTLTSEFADYEFPITSTEPLESITIDATKRLYVKSITIMHECGDEPVVPELVVTLPEVPAEHYKVGQEVKVKATVENGSENTKLTYSAKVGEETITLVADAETDNVTLPNKKSGNVEVTVTATDGDRTATDTKTYVFDRAPKIKINYTFDPEGLNYEKDQKVTLTVSTEGHFGEPTITYNVTKIVNGSTQPVVASTAYNGLITLPTNEVGDYRVTITASDEYDHVLEGNQNISTISPTYKVYSAINTIDEAQAGETIKFNGEAVVAYHYKDSQFENMWIRDAEDNSGLIKYQNFGSAKFAQRDKLAEGWTATYGMANSLSYFSDASNLNADGQVEKVEPYVLTTITADDVNKYASLSEIKITKEESGYYYFTVGDQEYRLAKKYCADAPEVGKYYNVVGVVTRNNDDIWMDLISIEEVNPVAIAGPTFCPAGGTYTEPKEVAIACATPGMKVMYKIGEGETWTEYTKPFKVSESCTVYAMGTMGNRTVYTDSEVTSATYTINALPAASITDGYYYLQSKAAETSGKWANVAGRRTLNFVDNADQQAGTVFRVMTDPDSIGQIETLRSQGADMQGYAKRAMAYVGPFIELVLDKIAGSTLGDPEAAGGILGENGVELILKKFTENFDYHLYVEGDATNGYRIYGRTPSMQHVVDFYHDNTDKVEEKLPMLEDYINQVIAKVNGKVQSANLEFPAYSLKTVRDRIAEKYGITLIDPEADMMGFYRQVLNNKEYVWDFAYQTAMIYLDAIKSSDAYKNIPNEYKAYVEKMEKVRPDTKYYIIERGNEPDYISENNVEINDARSFWTLEERPNFTVNFPAENKYGSKLVTTLYTDFAYDVPEGVTAYKVTAIDNGIATLADLGKNVPAQTPVLLMTEAAAKAEAVTKAVTLNTTDGTRPTDNKLEGPDYLIKKYEITSPTVELLFNVAEGIVGSEMMADYQYLKLRTSGTVNNRYFWGLSADDLKKCTEENSNGKLDCVVRALGVDEEGQNIGFYRNREAMAANQAFIPNIEFNSILLEVVATPTFAPEAGTYNEAQNVTIACETEGATIYYKTGDAEDWTEYDPEQPIRVEATTTIQAYAAKDGLGDSEIAEATYTIELPAEAPTFDPVPGSYTEAQQVTIIAPEGATVTYRIDGGEWQTYTEGEKIQVEATQTIMAKASKDGYTISETATGYYVIDIPEALPTDMPTFDGYYSVLNSGKYANIQGRKTLTFTDAPDAQAGTVIRLKSDNTGKVEVLRSQAADLQRYAYRAMDYVPDIVQIVVDKLGAEGEGHILGKDGLDAIMTKFDESFKPDLYIEKAGDNGYRIYGRTPSMQPVVDFYRENKDKVEAKLPDLVAFINSALAKLRNKANQAGMDGDNVFVDFDLKTIWTRMGGNLTDPEVDEMGFYRDVLNYKDNVWNFAYQTATFYLEKIKNTGTYTSLSEQLGEFAQYLDKIDQIHPDFKYYIVANEEVTKPDFISQGNADIINNAARTIWTIKERPNFTVNFPAENKYGNEYVTTLYTDFAYTLPEGVTAWAVTSVSDQGIGELTAIDGTTIAAQTPVLLKSTTAGDVATFGITTADGTAAPEGNLLVGPDYLIETYQIKTPEVVKMFEAIKTVLGENIYNDLVDKYGHLQFRTSGTVNNKYFWGLNEEEVKSCAEENPETGKKVKVVRSLGIKDDLLGFNDNEHVYTNKALLVSTEHSAINFSLRGDINKDGVISIIDVTALIDILLDLPAWNYLEPTTSYPKGLDYEAADVNENKDIEITDVTTLIDILLNMPDQPAQGGGN